MNLQSKLDKTTETILKDLEWGTSLQYSIIRNLEDIDFLIGVNGKHPGAITHQKLAALLNLNLQSFRTALYRARKTVSKNVGYRPSRNALSEIKKADVPTYQHERMVDSCYCISDLRNLTSKDRELIQECKSFSFVDFGSKKIAVFHKKTKKFLLFKSMDTKDEGGGVTRIIKFDINDIEMIF